MQDQYGYPALSAAVKKQIFGLNAASVYGVDPAATRYVIRNDDVERLQVAIAKIHAPCRCPTGASTKVQERGDSFWRCWRATAALTIREREPVSFTFVRHDLDRNSGSAAPFLGPELYAMRVRDVKLLPHVPFHLAYGRITESSRVELGVPGRRLARATRSGHFSAGCGASFGFGNGTFSTLVDRSDGTSRAGLPGRRMGRGFALELSTEGAGSQR